MIRGTRKKLTKVSSMRPRIAQSARSLRHSQEQGELHRACAAAEHPVAAAILFEEETGRTNMDRRVAHQAAVQGI